MHGVLNKKHEHEEKSSAIDLVEDYSIERLKRLKRLMCFLCYSIYDRI